MSFPAVSQQGKAVPSIGRPVWILHDAKAQAKFCRNQKYCILCWMTTVVSDKLRRISNSAGDEVILSFPVSRVRIIITVVLSKYFSQPSLPVVNYV